MRDLRLLALGGGLLALAAGADAAEPGPVPRPVVREAAAVRVAGVTETWRLVWDAPPVPACDPSDPGWLTCPCEGFAFGERGHLRLERWRGGTRTEELKLDDFFAGAGDAPAVIDEQHESLLRRSAPLPGDSQLVDDGKPLARRVARRRVSSAIRLADLDRDGAATEFLLQVGTLPCGKQMGIVLGVSRTDSRLHAFTTVEHPERPLTLERRIWERMARGDGRALFWPCGDHGATMQTELAWRIDGAGIHVKSIERACDGSGTAGPLTAEEDL